MPTQDHRTIGHGAIIAVSVAEFLFGALVFTASIESVFAIGALIGLPILTLACDQIIQHREMRYEYTDHDPADDQTVSERARAAMSDGGPDTAEATE